MYKKGKVTAFKYSSFSNEEIRSQSKVLNDSQINLIKNIVAPEDLALVLDPDTRQLCVNYSSETNFIEQSISGSTTPEYFSVTYEFYSDGRPDEEAYSSHAYSNKILVSINAQLEASVIYLINIAEMDKNQVVALGIDLGLVNRMFSGDQPKGEVMVDYQKFVESNPDFDLSEVISCLTSLQSFGVKIVNQELISQELSVGKIK